VHKVVGVDSSETEELRRFVAAAQRRRPQAWGHVERLKAACAHAPGNSPELRDVLRRVWRLEHEVESLRRESRMLQDQLALRQRTVSHETRADVVPAANANDYAGSGSA
jgi:hypothetical protein